MRWLSRLSLAQAMRRALLWPLFLAVAVGLYLLWDRLSGGEWVIESGVAPIGTQITFSDYLPTLAIVLLVVGPPMVLLLVWYIKRRSL